MRLIWYNVNVKNSKILCNVMCHTQVFEWDLSSLQKYLQYRSGEIFRILILANCGIRFFMMHCWSKNMLALQLRIFLFTFLYWLMLLAWVRSINFDVWLIFLKELRSNSIIYTYFVLHFLQYYNYICIFYQISWRMTESKLVARIL